MLNGIPTFVNDIELPSSFRRDLVSRIFGCIKKGESMSLVGVASIGKSNIALHLTRRDVILLHLQGQGQFVLGGLVDCMKLAKPDTLHLHRDLLRMLVGVVPGALHPITSKLGPDIRQLWSRAEDDTSENRVSNLLTDAIRAILQSGVERLYFILDDFDSLLTTAEPATLKGLRSLRDEFKPKVCFVSLTRREMHTLREPVSAYHDFYEMATKQTEPVGPYNYEDGMFMIERLLTRWEVQQQISTRERRQLLDLTGAHPGVLKAVLWATTHDLSLDPYAPNAAATLCTHKDIAPELSIIVDSLEKHEVREMDNLISSGKPTGAATRSLYRKGLLTSSDQQTWSVFSTLFRDYWLKRVMTSRTRISSFRLDACQRTVTREGATVALDPVAYALLTRLHQHSGQPINKNELRAVMLQAEQGQPTTTDPASVRLTQRLQTLMAQLNTPTRAYFCRNADDSYTLKEDPQ